jgi:hypothetical protein
MSADAAGLAAEPPAITVTARMAAPNHLIIRQLRQSPRICTRNPSTALRSCEHGTGPLRDEPVTPSLERRSAAPISPMVMVAVVVTPATVPAVVAVPAMMMPAVVAPMTVVMMPADLGRRLFGIGLDRRSSGGITQRQRLRLFRWSCEQKTCADRRKTKELQADNLRCVHINPPAMTGCTSAPRGSSRRATASPQRRSNLE